MTDGFSSSKRKGTRSRQNTFITVPVGRLAGGDITMILLIQISVVFLRWVQQNTEGMGAPTKPECVHCQQSLAEQPGTHGLAWR